MRFRTGLCSVSFRGNTPEEILQAVKSAGLSCIEWGSDVHAPKDDLENLNKIVRLQQQYGVECSSYGTYFRLGVTPISELEGYIGAAKILGTDILRLWCGDKNSEDYTEEQRDALFAECKKAAAIAERRGVILCMECHKGTYTNEKVSALELMRAVDSHAFRMYWQPNQFRTEEENLRYANLLSPYTEHLHVFNWKGKEKYPLAQGISVWKQYLERFEKGKTLLLEFMPDGKIESLKAEAGALFEIAGGIR